MRFLGRLVSVENVESYALSFGDSVPFGGIVTLHTSRKV